LSLLGYAAAKALPEAKNACSLTKASPALSLPQNNAICLDLIELTQIKHPTNTCLMEEEFTRLSFSVSFSLKRLLPCQADTERHNERTNSARRYRSSHAPLRYNFFSHSGVGCRGCEHPQKF